MSLHASGRSAMAARISLVSAAKKMHRRMPNCSMPCTMKSTLRPRIWCTVRNVQMSPSSCACSDRSITDGRMNLCGAMSLRSIASGTNISHTILAFGKWAMALFGEAVVPIALPPVLSTS